MFCPNCGAGFDDEAHFCSGCGKSLARVITHPKRYGATRPSDAAMGTIGTGVAADIRVKRMNAMWGLIAGGVGLLVMVPLATMHPAGGLLVVIMLGALAYQIWEYLQYDDAHQRIEKTAQEVDDDVDVAMRETQAKKSELGR